jgi:hypothetical protein
MSVLKMRSVSSTGLLKSFFHLLCPLLRLAMLRIRRILVSLDRRPVGLEICFRLIITHFRRITGDIVTSLVAKYQNEYSDEDDDGVMMDEQFEWEDEMRSLESRLGFYDKV